MAASISGHMEIVRELLQIGTINVNVADCYGETALTLATDEDKLDIVRVLLKCDALDANIRVERFGTCMTALVGATQMEQLDIVRELLRDDKVDVNAVDDTGRTALVWACANPDGLQVLHEILKHDQVDVNAQVDDGSTALTIAIEDGYLEVVRELLKHNMVDVNHVLKGDGVTALIEAIQESEYSEYEIVYELLNHSMLDVIVADKSGQTALIWASQR